MSNIEEINAEILPGVVPDANDEATLKEALQASRKLQSSRESPSGVRQSAATEMTPGECVGSPRSDKQHSSPMSQKSNKKRKHDEISNTEGAFTEAGGNSCAESNGDAESVQQSRKRMKANDGEPVHSPSKALSPKAQQNGSK